MPGGGGKLAPDASRAQAHASKLVLLYACAHVKTRLKDDMGMGSHTEPSNECQDPEVEGEDVNFHLMSKGVCTAAYNFRMHHMVDTFFVRVH